MLRIIGAIIGLLLLLTACSQRQPPAEVAPQPPATEVFWNKLPLPDNHFAPLPLGSVSPPGG